MFLRRKRNIKKDSILVNIYMRNILSAILIAYIAMGITSCASIEALDSIAEVVGNRAENYNSRVDVEKKLALNEAREKSRIESIRAKRKKERISSKNQTVYSPAIPKDDDVVSLAVKEFSKYCDRWCIPCNRSNGFPGIDHDRSSKACF